MITDFQKARIFDHLYNHAEVIERDTCLQSVLMKEVNPKEYEEIKAHALYFLKISRRLIQRAEAQLPIIP